MAPAASVTLRAMPPNRAEALRIRSSPFDISDVDSINYGHAIGTANHRRYPVITAVVYGKVSHFASEKHPVDIAEAGLCLAGTAPLPFGVEIRCEIRNSGSAQTLLTAIMP